MIAPRTDTRRRTVSAAGKLWWPGGCGAGSAQPVPGGRRDPAGDGADRGAHKAAVDAAGPCSPRTAMDCPPKEPEGHGCPATQPQASRLRACLVLSAVSGGVGMSNFYTPDQDVDAAKLHAQDV